jgi:hypothetical protein
MPLFVVLSNRNESGIDTKDKIVNGLGWANRSLAAIRFLIALSLRGKNDDRFWRKGFIVVKKEVRNEEFASIIWALLRLVICLASVSRPLLDFPIK